MQGFSRLTWAATPAFTIWRLWWRPGGTDCQLFLMICPTGAASSCGASTTTKVQHEWPQIQHCLSNLSPERHTFMSTCKTICRLYESCRVTLSCRHTLPVPQRALLKEGHDVQNPFRVSVHFQMSACYSTLSLSLSLSHCRTQCTHTLTHTHIFTLLSVQLSPAVTLKPFREAATAKCDVSSNLSSNSHSEALQ